MYCWHWSRPINIPQLKKCFTRNKGLFILRGKSNWAGGVFLHKAIICSHLRAVQAFSVHWLRWYRAPKRHFMKSIAQNPTIDLNKAALLIKYLPAAKVYGSLLLILPISRAEEAFLVHKLLILPFSSYNDFLSFELNPGYFRYFGAVSLLINGVRSHINNIQINPICFPLCKCNALHEHLHVQ